MIGIEARGSFPAASRAITSDFYADDLLTGAETAAEARQTKQKVETILLKSGFVLRKWASNDPPGRFRGDGPDRSGHQCGSADLRTVVESYPRRAEIPRSHHHYATGDQANGSGAIGEDIRSPRINSAHHRKRKINGKQRGD